MYDTAATGFGITVGAMIAFVIYDQWMTARAEKRRKRHLRELKPVIQRAARLEALNVLREASKPGGLIELPKGTKPHDAIIGDTHLWGRLLQDMEHAENLRTSSMSRSLIEHEIAKKMETATMTGELRSRGFSVRAADAWADIERHLAENPKKLAFDPETGLFRDKLMAAKALSAMDIHQLADELRSRGYAVVARDAPAWPSGRSPQPVSTLVFEAGHRTLNLFWPPSLLGRLVGDYQRDIVTVDVRMDSLDLDMGTGHAKVIIRRSLPESLRTA